MPAITSTGIISGIDTDAIIEKLLELENRQVSQLTTRQAGRTTRLSSWTGLQTAVFGLRTAALALNAADTWRGVTATSGDESVLEVSGSPGAAAGTHQFRVNRLASAHQIASQGFADPDATSTGTGTLAIGVGGSTYSVNIDASHATLNGIRDAVNAAGIGVHASIVNTGSGGTPYRLVLASEKTGATNVISVTGSLTGGTAPSFATTRGEAVNGTWSGTSAATAGGAYTGLTNRTFTFTAAGSGTVGSSAVTFQWSDDLGGSGTVQLAPGYTPGSAVTVADGVTVAFTAGTVVSGDDFSIAVTSPTIQAAQDAEIEIGDAGAGGAPITVTRSSNVITDLVDGLTITLRAPSDAAVTVSVNRDTAGIRDALKNFVNSYNSLTDLARSQATYDAETQTAAPLLGDGGLITLKSQVRSVMTGAVPEIRGSVRALSALGVRTLPDGQLSIDYTKLDGLLEDDFASVERLLRATGTASDSDIVYRTSGAKTVASAAGYGVVITRAATQAAYAGNSIAEPSEGSPLVITGANDALVVSVDRVKSGVIRLNHGSYASGASLASELEARINADGSLGEAEVTVRWVDDGGGNGHLKIASKRYGSASSIWWQDAENSAYASLGLVNGGSAYGIDVAGTIGGEAATGDGRILTGDEDNERTAGLSVVVNLTPEQLAVQGGSQGTLTFTRGLGDLVAAWADQATDTSNGLISRRQAAIQGQVDRLTDQINRVREQAASKRESLIATFSNMETVLSRLQNEGNFLSSALSTLRTR